MSTQAVGNILLILSVISWPSFTIEGFASDGLRRSGLVQLSRVGPVGFWVRDLDLPLIRFLFVESRLCSTLPSDPASRRRPCASLTLLLRQDG